MNFSENIVHQKKHAMHTMFLILFLFLPLFLNAQITVNPSHDFYADALRWQTKGYTSFLPPLRPYPYANIMQILNDVLTDENVLSSDYEQAQKYYEQLTGKKWHIAVTAGANSSENKLIRIHPEYNGDITTRNEMFNFGYKLGFDCRTLPDETSSYPRYSLPFYDSIQDPARIGPLYSYLDYDGVLSFGKENIFVQTGINRKGFGNFINYNIALNENSYHSGNFSLTYMNDFISYMHSISVIGASRSYDGTFYYPDKYLAFHSIEFKILPTLGLTYYENMIFGKRFDPSYLIPAVYMATQGINGCDDNLQMGIAVSWKFLKKFSLDADIFVDDVDFNRAVKFDLDSKNRISATAGLKYYSDLSFIDKIEFDYSLITPFTYSHWDNEASGRTLPTTVNYQNYTNCGVKIGSPFDPNSDAFRLTASFKPIDNLNVSLGFNFIRHANVFESITDEEALEYLMQEKNTFSTDGSVFSHSMLQENKNMYTAWNKLNFLTQQHKCLTVRPEINASYKISNIFSKADLSISLGYAFEYIKNDGISSHLYPGGQITVTEDINEDGKITKTYHWLDKSYSDKEDLISHSSEIADYYRKNWASSLKDTINNLLSIYVTFSW